MDMLNVSNIIFHYLITVNKLIRYKTTPKTSTNLLSRKVLQSFRFSQ